MSAISTSAWPRLVGNIRRTVTTLVTGSYADSYGAVILNRSTRLLPDRAFWHGPVNGRLVDDDGRVRQRQRVVALIDRHAAVQAERVGKQLSGAASRRAAAQGKVGVRRENPAARV